MCKNKNVQTGLLYHGGRVGCKYRIILYYYWSNHKIKDGMHYANPLLYSLGGQSIDELASEYYVFETFKSTSTGNYDNVDECMKEIISIPTVI